MASRGEEVYVLERCSHRSDGLVEGGRFEGAGRIFSMAVGAPRAALEGDDCRLSAKSLKRVSADKSFGTSGVSSFP